MDIQMEREQIVEVLCHFERTRYMMHDHLAFMLVEGYVRRGPLNALTDNDYRLVGYSLTRKGIRLIADAGYSHEEIPPIEAESL